MNAPLIPPPGIASCPIPNRVLMGPGPSDMHPRVVAALGHSAIGHLDPAFVAMMEEIKVLLRYAFQTENALTFAVSGPGSVGMETCFVNLVEPGDKVIVCRNGVFGGRMIENVQRFGGTAVVVEDTWGEPVDPRKVADALKANPDAKMVAFVHAETSTGAQSDAAALVKLAREAGCLSIVDTVTSLGGTPVLADAWGADAIYSGSQKCLSCVPGLAPVTFSERAVERVKARKQKVPSWFMDLGLVLEYWSAPGGKRTYHHTAPMHLFYALREGLRLVAEEGLAARWARHQATSSASRGAQGRIRRARPEVRRSRGCAPAAAQRRLHSRRRGRRGGAQAVAGEIQPGNRRRAGAAGRQGLALRPDGPFGAAGECRSVSRCPRRRAVGHGQGGRQENRAGSRVERVRDVDAVAHGRKRKCRPWPAFSRRVRPVPTWLRRRTSS